MKKRIAARISVLATIRPFVGELVIHPPVSLLKNLLDYSASVPIFVVVIIRMDTCG